MVTGSQAANRFGVLQLLSDIYVCCCCCCNLHGLSVCGTLLKHGGRSHTCQLIATHSRLHVCFPFHHPTAAAAPTQTNSNSSSSSLTHSHTHSSGPAGLLLLHEETTNELLEYLRGLDATSLADLTSCADSEVAQAMEAFVGRLMGTTDRDSLSRAGSDCTAQELAKVMFWLMIVGYTLRGLEVRWDMKASVLSGGGAGAGGGLSCDNSHEAW